MWEENEMKSLVVNPTIKKSPLNVVINVKDAKQVSKHFVKQKTIQYWNTKVTTFTFQGHFLKLL